MNTAYQDLINKLDHFIRQYYKVRMIRGALLSVLLIIVSFMGGAVLEYFNHFRPVAKTILFFGLIGLWIFVVGYYFVWPLLQFFRIGRSISYRQASQIIVRHFSHIEDKLLNVLELGELSKHTSSDLIDAGIRQKVDLLRPIPFVRAIDYEKTKKIIWVFLGGLLLAVTVYWLKPTVLKEGGRNLWHYSVYAEPPNPFHFVLKTRSLSVESGHDLTLEVAVEGRYIPEKVMIVFGGQAFLMTQTESGIFTYHFKTLLHSLSFYFSAGTYQSRDYRITVLPLPTMKEMMIEINPPTYTDIKSTVKNAVGDLTVPVGSVIRWHLKTEHADSVFFSFSDSSMQQALLKDHAFHLSQRLLKNTNYSIRLFNKSVKKAIVSSYRIQVIPDRYPEIQVKEYVDSLHPTVHYFSGIIKDDYGFSKLSFNYTLPNDSVVSTEIKLADGSFQPFEFGYDFSQISGDIQSVSYYFEVWDNDAVHGAKSTRSELSVFEKPSVAMLDSIENATNEAVQRKLSETQKLAEDIKNDIDKLKRDKIEQQLSSWEKQKLLQSIAEKQQRLDQLLKNMARQNKEKNELQKTFSKQSKAIAEKQKEIQKLLETVMDDELKKLMKELQKLLDEHANEKQLEQKTNEMEMRFDELSKQLDKNLELLKRYEVEKRMEQLSQGLDSLAKQQQKLSEAVKKKSNALSELQKQQQKQQQAFEKLRQEYEQTKEKNSRLETPYELKDFKSQMEKISQQFRQGQQQMQSGKRSKSAKTQRQNSQDLSKLARNMSAMMQQQMAQQAGEDIQKLKALMDNIVTFSFEQEALMKETKKISFRSAKLNELRRKQHKLKQSFALVEDSLFALSKRHPVLDQTVQKELTTVMLKLSQVESALQNSRSRQVASNQQFIMTSANNLAVLLDDIIRQMENRKKQSQQGNKSCPNPGNSNPQMGQMKSQMQSLKQQLQQMINEMKQGKSGSQKGKNGRRHSRQLGKMLSEYEKFNQALQEMMNSEGLSPEAMRQLKEIKKLIDKNINDLIHDRVTTETLRRHDDIKVRLLESEKAKRQRKMDEKRESREAKMIPQKQVSSYFKKQPEKVIFNDLLKKSNIKLNRFYEKKYKTYLMKISR